MNFTGCGISNINEKVVAGESDEFTFFSAQMDFLSEAEMMKRLEHKNIVRLLGVCTRGEPVYAVMEFMLHGTGFDDLLLVLPTKSSRVPSQSFEKTKQVVRHASFYRIIVPSELSGDFCLRSPIYRLQSSHTVLLHRFQGR
jgi:hypothetical protein